MKIAYRILILCVLILSPWQSAPVQAASSDWQGIEETQVRLISASSTLGTGQNLMFGLHFKMIEGWKVYWRSPGDAGFPPELTWQDPNARIASEMLWPRPERFEVLGLETLGYKNEVVYPLMVHVTDPDQPLTAQAQLNFLTCDDICVPVSVDLALDVTPGPARFSDEARLINKFKSQVPLKGDNTGVHWQKADVFKAENGKDGLLRITLETDWPLNQPDAIAEGPVELVFQNPVIEQVGPSNTYVVDVAFDGLQFLEKPLGRAPFTLTLMDPSHSVETTGPMTVSDQTPPVLAAVSSAPASELGAEPGIGLAQILVFAVIGGFILNAMPCVLPVLSIKLFGVMKHGGGDLKVIRTAFLASVAGILFSFLILAGFLIALKASGAAIGWGIQFQQPIFLIALALIIVLFACNMWGFYEFRLPEKINRLGTLENGQQAPVVKHFLSGAFATVLATPCSAPFLGTAVGFALSRGAGEIVMVFSALGLGLALPYLVFALKPEWISRLPKPGPWMVRLRVVLGFALLATAIWLLSVLISQIGGEATAVMAALCVCLVAILGFRKQVGRLRVPMVLAVILSAFFVPHTIAKTEQVNAQDLSGVWKPFSKAAIERQVAQGHIVFVDVTADWCITCQVNKKVVLDQDPIASRLQDPSVIALKADWTSPDPTIADYLAGYGRYGIPFNVVYGPSAPNGIVLPEILSTEGVRMALEQAK